MDTMQKSFIREILAVAQQPEVISFAGGLPNPDFFPGEALRAAANRVLADDPQGTLQYAPTLGYRPLREFIAQRYADTAGLAVDPDHILITNGSQQAVELVAKILIDPGDQIVVEGPSYLGGIQAFSLYEPRFVAVPLREDGIDSAEFAARVAEPTTKLAYLLPTFQNPTGISYSAETRQQVADTLAETNTFFIEDDPYRELRFAGDPLPPIVSLGRGQGFLLGSFSKIVAPGLRMGWIVAPPALLDKLIIAKQATDLHSNYLSQRVLCQYLQDNDLDAHIAQIRTVYQRQGELMMQLIDELFPAEVRYVKPEGGMFLWLTLPEGMSSMALFETATAENVVFVPGHPFFIDGSGTNTLRLNFSNTNSAEIETGIRRLAVAMKQQFAQAQQT